MKPNKGSSGSGGRSAKAVRLVRREGRTDLQIKAPSASGEGGGGGGEQGLKAPSSVLRAKGDNLSCQALLDSPLEAQDMRGRGV